MFAVRKYGHHELPVQKAAFRCGSQLIIILTGTTGRKRRVFQTKPFNIFNISIFSMSKFTRAYKPVLQVFWNSILTTTTTKKTQKLCQNLITICNSIYSCYYSCLVFLLKDMYLWTFHGMYLAPTLAHQLVHEKHTTESRSSSRFTKHKLH